jgi:hypothetical protein
MAHLNEGVNVVHQRLGPVHDKLVHTGDGVGPGGQWSQGLGWAGLA